MLEKNIIGLFYPAVLGGIIYQLGTATAEGPVPISSILICVAIIFHYAVDYTATFALTDRKKTERNYNKRATICDFIIIAALFIAANSIFPASVFPIYALFFAMAATKLFTILWDCSVFGEAQRLWCDVGFGGVYLLSAICVVVKHVETGMLLHTCTFLFLWPLLLILTDAGFYAHHLSKHHLSGRGGTRN